ncbi:MAG: zinc-dependent metalloprotease, partial [candidate division Zixibacteria bacterium]
IESLPDDFAGKDSLTKEYVHSYIVQLIAHEVGHTLGFRHNFKASTIYTLDQINDRAFTREHGNIGTIMEYPSVNIAGPDQVQGEFYGSTPGPYDDWIVEYAYTDLGDLSTDEEREHLELIASKAADPLLAYGTDYDGFGYSIKSPDPLCHLFDLGSDPLEFAEHQLGLTDELWTNAIKKFETPGARYQKIYTVFLRGWIAYSQAVRFATKTIGGIHRNKSRVGDPGAGLPFEPATAAEQQRAMDFLISKIFAADAFDIPSDLLNKLQYELMPNFTGSAYRVPTVDFPIHQRVLGVHQLALSRLYSPFVIGRLLNNTARVADGDAIYSMHNMFTDLRRSIWSEMINPSNTNSYRRQLQLAHLNRIMGIYLSGAAVYPTDARTLAANDLDILEGVAKSAVNSSSVDEMTKAHFKEVKRQIASAKDASRDYTKR